MEQAITEQWVAQSIPRRARSAHKGTYGTLTILAGCSSYRGAAALATAAALRAGAGIVRLASTEKVCAAVAASYNCCILSPLPETEGGGIDPAALPGVLAGKTTAILAGCGLGNTTGTAALVEGLLARTTCPLLLDADALNVCAGHFTGEHPAATKEKLLALMKNRGRPLVLTPHIGEMARLCGLAPAEVQRRQSQTALGFARQYRCVVVLKSHQTVVATPEGDTFYTGGSGNPGLAKG
ncbi:MAG: NAD(P)H-hydrate dehydratase, partial [Oscillospiraceae bacterium]